MVRLVTQYNNVNHGRLFEPGSGWDGANGPWVLHLIKQDNTQSSLASAVGIDSGYECSVEDWLSDAFHLNSFRLELVYE